MLAQRLLRRLFRLLSATLMITASLLSFVIVAAGLYLSTAHGRAQLIGVVVTHLNGILPGTLAVGALERLTPSSLTFDRVTLAAGGGNEVLSVERLQVELELMPLLRGQIVASRVSLEGAEVDLRAPTDRETGLVSALVPPASDTDAPQEAAGDPLIFIIERIELARVHARLPQPAAIAPSDLYVTQAGARLRVGDALDIGVEQLEVQLRRGRETLGDVALHGGWRPGGDSRASVVGILCGAAIDLDVALGATETLGWWRAPLDISLSIRGLTSERLADAIDVRGVHGSFSGQTNVTLHLQGSARQLDATATLESAGGPLSLAGTLRDLSDVDLRLSTRRLELARVFEAAPNWSLSTHIAFHTESASEASGRLLEATTSLAIDDVTLPTVHVRATRDPASAWQLDARVEEDWLRLASTGVLSGGGTLGVRTRARVELARALRLARQFGVQLGDLQKPPSGKVDLDLDLNVDEQHGPRARATLSAARLEAGAARLEQLFVKASFAPGAPLPTLHVDATWQAARAAAQQFSPGRLRLDGGPARYAFELRSGALERGSINAAGWLERRAGESELALHASGLILGTPWRVETAPFRVRDDGDVQLPKATLAVAGQHAELSGHYSPRRDSDVTLKLLGVDVARALAPLQLGAEVGGRLDLALRFRGTPGRPRLDVASSGANLRTSAGAGLDTRIDASIDTAAGTLTAEATAREHSSRPGVTPRLDVALKWDGRFATTGEFDWRRALGEGEHRATLAVTRLDADAIGALLGTTLPLMFDLRGNLSLALSRGAPSVGSSWQGRIGWLDGSRAAAAGPRSSLRHDLAYEAGQLRTVLALADEEGPWVKFSGRGAFDPSGPRPDVFALLEATGPRWLEVLRRAIWNIELSAQPRPLARLPLSPSLVGLATARVGGRLVATRELDRPPEGTLELAVSDATTRTSSSACARRPLDSRARIEVQRGRLRATLGAYQGSRERLSVRTEAPLDISSLLRGERLMLPPLDLALHAEKLPLSGLPVVCESARGELSIDGHVRDALGSAPEASARLDLRRFSLGSDETLDLNATLALTPRRLEVQGVVDAEGRRSRLNLDVPRRAPGAPSDAGAPPPTLALELRRLPIAPLFPPGAPISHASGYLTGDVRVSGTRADRRQSGSLMLQDVAFTITELAQPLTDVNAQVDFDDAAVVLKQASARDGAGALSAQGKLSIRDIGSVAADMNLVARKFPLRQGGEVVASTSATAHVTLDWRPAQRNIAVELRDFDTWLEQAKARQGLSLEQHPDLVIASLGRRAARNTAGSTPAEPQVPNGPEPTPPARLVLDIDATQEFWVRRADFAVKLAADLQVAITPPPSPRTPPEVQVTGELRFERGYLELLGKVFDIERGGLLRFTGGSTATLDLTARYNERRSNKTVEVHLGGSGTAPQLDFFVDGEKVTAGEAFKAIYGSDKEEDEENLDPEAQTKQFVSALTAGVLTTNIRRRFGAMAPIVSIDTADSTSSGQVRAGFELDTLVPDFLRGVVTGVYVEGVFTSEKTSEEGGDNDVDTGVLIELHFPYNLVATGRYGPDTTWSLDLGWQR